MGKSGEKYGGDMRTLILPISVVLSAFKIANAGEDGFVENGLYYEGFEVFRAQPMPINSGTDGKIR